MWRRRWTCIRLQFHSNGNNQNSFSLLHFFFSSEFWEKCHSLPSARWRCSSVGLAHYFVRNNGANKLVPERKRRKKINRYIECRYSIPLKVVKLECYYNPTAGRWVERGWVHAAPTATSSSIIVWIKGERIAVIRLDASTHLQRGYVYVILFELYGSWSGCQNDCTY